MYDTMVSVDIDKSLFHTPSGKIERNEIYLYNTIQN